jgi:catechol 2,3-dioxygenase-like lactoylglutathione lyase family enzyme
MFDKTEAFSGFAVKDLDEARRFYGETLGMEFSEGEMGFLRLHVAGGHDILVYPKPDHPPANYTMLNFLVDDVDATVDELASRGVKFERYEGFDQDERGVARGDEGPAIAWFEDPSGNILSVLEA